VNNFSPDPEQHTDFRQMLCNTLRQQYYHVRV